MKTSKKMPIKTKVAQPKTVKESSVLPPFKKELKQRVGTTRRTLNG